MAEKCGCADCRNFIAARAALYPPAFHTFLDELGIDPAKEGDLMLQRWSEDGRQGTYYGCFHCFGACANAFVSGPGSVEDWLAAGAVLGPGFRAWVSLNSWPALEPLKGAPLMIEFFAQDVAWLLPRGGYGLPDPDEER